MSRALLGLGANLGDREDTLARAIDALNALPRTAVKRASSLYETAPVGYADQPDFLNLVAELETTLAPHALLGACLGIEAALGRRRSFPNAPRVVDIDLLRYDDQTCDTPDLILPHPRMAQRAFVLVPLAELFPDHTVDGWDFAGALKRVAAQDVRLWQPGKNFKKV
ncbi:MAG: 2-amino-4-hydroxy-6-hydroxymethyldihydropteridine diphosphokinase [Acutalibacteraceae bacterium]|jgi:2-amino-4-hydroxy-6-hydroxymethyldihydropteridine diphosphokinase